MFYILQLIHMVRKILRKKGMQTVLERYSASTEVIVTEFQFSNHKSIGGRSFSFLQKHIEVGFSM
mgnify:CR=1 FL=1|jgi:hypothetical protein